MNYRIGIDGGGTKTRAVVINKFLQIVGEGADGSSNPYAVGIESAVAHILAAADAALNQAKLRRDELGGWGLGLGGVCSQTESEWVETALRALIGAEVPIVAVEDVVAAHAGAFGPEKAVKSQIVCIAGTGANCFGRSSGGQTAKADGLGPLLGDRGSGYRIGEAALRLFGMESDGVNAPTDFSDAILAHFGAKNVSELIQIVYSSDFERSRVASIAPVVVNFAPQHEGARAILENAGRELAQTARAVLGRLGPLENPEIRGEVALVGGVLAGADLVRASFQKALGKGVALVEARYESAIGAALLVSESAPSKFR